MNRETIIASPPVGIFDAKAMMTPAIKKRFGLPERPWQGYCGLAGVPE